MNYSYNDYERYYYYDDLDCLSYDCIHSFTRRRELEYRKCSGYDTYCGGSDDCSEEWN